MQVQFNSVAQKQWDEICIIDDSMIPGLITRKVCEQHIPEVPVRLFSSVDRALDHLKTFVKTRRIIFLDLHMPDKNGFDFLEDYKPTKDEKVFILSSSSIEDEVSKALSYEAVDAFIPKPISPEILVTIVKESIAV